MGIKRYTQFIREASENVDPADYAGIRSDVEKMIKDTVGEEGDVKKFAQKYIKNPDQVEIEGLINDDQVHDFWLKYENEIDEILNKVKFFEESPDNLNAIGTYKYIIVSTKRAVKEIVKMIAD